VVRKAIFQGNVLMKIKVEIVIQVVDHLAAISAVKRAIWLETAKMKI
jgi:hypothetical protein